MRFEKKGRKANEVHCGGGSHADWERDLEPPVPWRDVGAVPVRHLPKRRGARLREVRRLVIALCVLAIVCVALLILVELLAGALQLALEENREIEQMDDCSLPGYGYYTADYWKEKEDEE